MSYGGTRYTAEQDLYEASRPKDANNPNNDALTDEWMKLTCANDRTGWLLMRDVAENSAFDEPNIVEYGQASDL